MLNTDFNEHNNPTLKGAINEAIRRRFSKHNSWVELTGKSGLTKTDLIFLNKFMDSSIKNEFKNKTKHCIPNALSFILNLSKHQNNAIKKIIKHDFCAFKELANAVGFKHLNYGY
jgi:hypothetical protein